MKIYYAHHVWKYDTPIENFEIKCIERQFKDAVIVNPRTTIPQDQPESVILDYAYKALDDCEAIVFSTFSGMIGHGVFNEIIYAFNAGKKVYQLDGTELEVTQILLSMEFVILFSVVITECTPL